MRLGILNKNELQCGCPDPEPLSAAHAGTLVQSNAHQFRVQQVACWMLAPDSSLLAPPAYDEALLAEVAGYLLSSWQVLPLTAPRFFKWIPAEAGAALQVKQLQWKAEAVTTFSRLQVMTWRRMSKPLIESRVPYVLLKSSALRWLLYESPELRCGEDIDLATTRPYLRVVRGVLESIGFEAAQWSNEQLNYVKGDPVLRSLVEASHYELGFLVTRLRVRGLSKQTKNAIMQQLGSPWLWVVGSDGMPAANMLVDVHHGISPEISAEPIVQERRLLDIAGVECAVPPLGWAMFHLIYKLYWEGVHQYGSGFYQYADICRLAPMLNGQAVEQLKGLLVRWKLEAAAYYVLRQIEPMFGVSLPADLAQLVLECSHPDKKSKPALQNDHGDVWPRLWGKR